MVAFVMPRVPSTNGGMEIGTAPGLSSELHLRGIASGLNDRPEASRTTDREASTLWQFLTDLFLHLDVVLQAWTSQYGVVVYVLLFLVVFLETGLVVTPFLPGDSLLFAGGAVAAVSADGLNVWLLGTVLFTAAVLGDLANYWIGRACGRRILDSGRFSRVIKPRHITETEAFFARHGGKTVSLARFFPFIRTFTPFVAGISRMELHRFVAFNVAGGAGWVSLFVAAGYLFGNIPFVAHNLQYLVMGIVVVSLLPAVWQFLRRWRSDRQHPGGDQPGDTRQGLLTDFSRTPSDPVSNGSAEMSR